MKIQNKVHCLIVLLFCCLCLGTSLYSQTKSASHWKPAYWNQGEILFYSYSLSKSELGELYSYNLKSGEVKTLLTANCHLWFPSFYKNEKITFSSDSSFQERYGGSNIYVLDLKTNKVDAITHYKDRMAACSSFSPDGKKIVFMDQKAWGKGDCEIMLYDVQTKETTNISNHPSRDEIPSWSPDGKNLIFHSNRTGSKEIFIYNLANKEIKQLTNDPLFNNEQAIWSPDGTKVAYNSVLKKAGYKGKRFLKILDLESQKMINKIRIDQKGKWMRELTWSPDGQTMIGSLGDSNNSEIWTLNLKNKRKTKMTIPDIGISYQADYGPALSPDQKKLVYYSYRGVNLPEIFVWDLKKNKETKLTSHPNAWDLNPLWYPDGNHIYFSSTLKGSMALYKMEADGQNVEQVSFPEEGVNHSEISFSRDGKKMLYASFNPNGASFILRDLNTNQEQEIVKSKNGEILVKPVLHPDGTELIFLRAAKKDEPFDIFSFDIGTKVRKNLSKSTENERMTKWSKDGKFILFSSDDAQSSYDLYKMPRGGGQRVRLTNFPDRQELNSFLSEKRLFFDCGYYGIDENKNTYIYIAKEDGSTPRPLTKPENY